jgi:hypothetical protein
MTENKYKTVKDYAATYGITEKTVYNHIESGKISKERVKKVLNITLIKA